MKRCAAGLWALALAGQAATITVTNVNDSGPGSLRQALLDISTAAAPRVVAFNLSPTGAVHTIALLTPLNLVSDTLVDGTTQPLFSNPPPVRVVAAPGFSGSGGFWSGVSSNATVRGLYIAGFTNGTGVLFTQPNGVLEQCWVISNYFGVSMTDATGCRIGGPAPSNRCYVGWNSFGVHLQGYLCHDNLVAGNAIGAVPGPGGSAVAAPNAYGVILTAGAYSNIVRGSAAALQLISGNSSAGVSVEGDATDNRIEGNLIGTDPTGLGALPNNYGVQVFGSNTVIGGGAASNRNVIAGNTQYGVYLNSGANGTRVLGNYIGVTAGGSPAVTGQTIGVLGIFAGHSVIAGSAAAPQIIAGHSQYGIRLLYDTGTVIRGNSIGIGSGGTSISNGTGVSLGACLDTLVGGTNAADRNVIGGNNIAGVAVQYCRGVRVEGNLIGMEPSGLPRPTGTGIDVLDSTNIVLGGSTTNARNYIAGTFLGIAIGNAGSTNVQVLGNHIGLTPAGALLTNSSSGISVAGPYGTIGGSNSAAERNVIAGNTAGIFLTGPLAHHNVVVGNYVGTDPAGVASRSNSSYGIWIYQAPSNRVGGRSASERNVISGNAGYGIAITDSNAVDNEVLGNYIGTTASGLAPLGNGLATNFTSGAGVLVQAPRNRIGGSGAARNVISANRIGVAVSQAAGHHNQVEGNYIGVDASGMGALGNLAQGVHLSVFAYSNTIGSTAAGAGNVISGNGDTGVYLAGVSNNMIQGNTIGPALDQATGFTNQGYGVTLSSAKDCLVGGPGAGARNLISGHRFYGVQVLTFSSGARVEGNWIGLNGTGAAALSNHAAGVLLNNSSGSNVIRGNVISGNGEGIALLGTNCPGDWVAGNWIGTDGTGTQPVRNKGNGISLADGVGLRIGGTGPGDGNVIAFNGSNGVAVTFAITGQGTRDALLGNLIYSNTALAIDLNQDGATANDAAPDADMGANLLQNHPVVTNAVQGLTLVQGSFISSTSQAYLLEFYASPSGGQARVFLGRTNLVMGATGSATFTYVLGGTAPTGWVVAASATDTNGNTSELSPYSAAARIKPAVDGDGDGLWDTWEQANFGGSLANNGSGDNDGDGVNNYAEFVADTSPTNSSAFFELVVLTNSLPHYPGWPSSAARFYDLEYSTNLLAPAWVGLASNLPGSGGVMTVADPADRTTRIYRARAKLP